MTVLVAARAEANNAHAIIKIMKFTKANKKLSLIITIILIGILLAFTAFIIIKNQKEDRTRPQIIIGKVDRTSDGCNVDGICSVTLDGGQKIITGCGLSAGGKTCKVYNQSKLRLGQRVEARVMYQENSTYNLECSTCTIQPLD